MTFRIILGFVPELSEFLFVTNPDSCLVSWINKRKKSMAKFKAVLVGAGGMGKGWGKNLTQHEDVELAAWVDIRPEAAAAAVEELKLIRRPYRR